MCETQVRHNVHIGDGHPVGAATCQIAAAEAQHLDLSGHVIKFNREKNFGDIIQLNLKNFIDLSWVLKSSSLAPLGGCRPASRGWPLQDGRLRAGWQLWAEFE